MGAGLIEVMQLGQEMERPWHVDPQGVVVKPEGMCLCRCTCPIGCGEFSSNYDYDWAGLTA